MKKENKNVKMNLTLSREFYQRLKNESAQDFMKVSTWVKQQLMRLVYNKQENSMNENGNYK